MVCSLVCSEICQPAVCPVVYLLLHSVVYAVRIGGFHSARLELYVLLVISLAWLITAGHGILRLILPEHLADCVASHRDSFATRVLGVLVRMTRKADPSISL